MKISIITVCYNCELTIKSTIESVINQTYKNIEYIIVDGASKDKTVEIVKSFNHGISCFISEPDKGMYNALNKGIKLATGDVVGIIHADDFLNNDKIIEIVASEFTNNDIDALYGDVQFVNPENLSKIVRYYSSKWFKPSRFKYGFMPAHPSFYVKREFYTNLGDYKEDYMIGSDFDLLIRFIYKNNIRCKYIPIPFVTMRTGGVSNKTIKNRLIANNEILRACKENGIKTNMFNIYSKYFIKIFEFINKC
ncbi:MAG: glycosyltransferase family 2 protein [Tenuifilaceae bacterium]